jgi:hypothetical protein
MPNVDDLRRDGVCNMRRSLADDQWRRHQEQASRGAAMGRPIVCTPRAAMDLRSGGQLPFLA